MLKFFENMSLSRIIATSITLVIAVILWLVLKKIFKKWTNNESEQGSQSLVAPVLWSVLRFIIVIVAIICILEINGVDVTSAIAGLGIAATIVGLALQDALKDIIMGIHIMMDKFFKVGDAVIYNGDLGVIVDFNLKTTKIRTIDAPGLISICNRKIEEIKLAGESNIVDIPICYDADTAYVDEVVKNSCYKIREIEGIKGCIYAGMNSFGDSAIMYRVFVLCTPRSRYPMIRAAIRVIKDDLDAAGIKIPYNQLDIHFDQEVRHDKWTDKSSD